MADLTVADTFTTDRNKHDFTVYKRFLLLNIIYFTDKNAGRLEVSRTKLLETN